MSATSVDLCNIALMRIGVTVAIAALTDTSAEGKACNRIYAQARDEVLTSVDWPFAEKRAVLVENTSEVRDDWEHVYAAPTDCLKPRAIYPGVRNPRADQRVPFQLQDGTVTGDAVARWILTDAEQTQGTGGANDGPVLFYTEAVTDVPRFTALFREALEWRIAADLSLALPKVAAKELMCRQRYEAALARALAVAHRTGQEDQPPSTRYLASRG